LARAISATAKEKGWWDGFPGPEAFVPNREGKVSFQQVVNYRIGTALCLIHSEVSEALEALRIGDMYHFEGSDSKPEGIASELADVIIRVLDLSEALGIDIGQAIIDKMRYNERRAHRHGGKSV
jgi:NTP pyrophosphatase (non-canonical NTP hydrolase)